ncbi:PIN domain-containing protein [Nanoarchaeota archaeon]
MENQLYFDTCIWLNLFKKEGDLLKGESYWKIAEDLIKRAMFSQDFEIVYSGIVLKEMKYKLNDDFIFKEKLKFFKKEFRFVKTTNEDYSLARKLESEHNYRLSFYDFLHISLCKRMEFTLVTRDKDLMVLSKGLITVKKPEELLT